MKAVLALALLAACGGGDDGIDLGGVYQVTADVSSAPCGDDQPVPSPPAYLSFSKMEVFGAQVWTYQLCSDAAASMCDGSSGLFGGFTEPIDNGWKGVLTEYSYGGSCFLDYQERTAILMNTMLVIDASEYSDMPTLDQTHCTTDEAEKRGKTMPCVMHERIEATKL